jgi:putative OPT family oligopeptide transporter
MAEDPKSFQPFVPASASPPELTVAPIIVGSLLGILFGASSIYLVLKVGLTVSASIPVAVLAFALFRVISKAFGQRNRTVLENNIVQTTGSAGESIAFGVGLVMPALLIMGFDIDVVKVMTVGVFGGLLGILMMIPLRRAFIVQKHGELKYPEGTACADVLKAGEKGGSTAGTLVVGLVIGFIFQFAVQGFKLLKEDAGVALGKILTLNGKAVGLKGASISSEMSAPLLGVGYIIGPKIAGIMVAGGVLAYLIIGPIINTFGENQSTYITPAKQSMKEDEKTGEKVDHGFIKNMKESEVRKNYILYIGAGAVAAGGIISMLKALPVILGSVVAGFRDLTGGKNGGSGGGAVPRTDRDLPIWVVVFGSLGMVVAMFAAAPLLGLGYNWGGVAGAVMILLFGFLFVTVSSRLTGEIGSSSNPISGMTVATLLLTCMILLTLSQSGYLPLNREMKLLALMIAGVVCVASSNGGTTSQALKTGHLLGATPKYQTYAIIIGSLTSALVVGLVLIVFNQVGTVYTKRPEEIPAVTLDVTKLTQTEKVKTGQYADDPAEYKVLLYGKGKTEVLPEGLIKSGDPTALTPGRYLVGADGKIVYRCDPAVTGSLDKQDNGEKVLFKFEAPKTQLVVLIIDGILDGELPWDLVLIGIVIAVMLELCGLPSLAFAVGVYLPLSSSVPIFLGGMVRAMADKLRNRPDEGDSSPGVLLGSGYIAGGSIAALIAAGIQFMPSWVDALNLAPRVLGHKEPESDAHVSVVFAALAVILLVVGVVAGRKK